MPDIPLNENDELLGIARRYFARLAAGPVPRGLDSDTAFAPPSRWPQARRTVSAPIVFVVVGTLLFLVIMSAGHVLTTRRSPSGTAPTAPAVSPTATPPPGGPVPAVLNGVWHQTSESASQPPTLTFFNGTTFELQISSRAFGGGISFGSVVVNGSEIDLFNGDTCAIPLPGGVGRYRWTLQNGVLHFTPLNEDPCSMRSLKVANQSYTKQHG